MIHRSRVQTPPFERLRRLYAGAVGMAPEPPEMLPLSAPRHAVGVDVDELEDMEAAVHAARARAAVAGARRALRALSAGQIQREVERVYSETVAIARREALR